MGATLHMLEARNQRLSEEASSLQQRMVAMSDAHDVLMAEREELASKLKKQEQVRASAERMSKKEGMQAWWWSPAAPWAPPWARMAACATAYT